MICTLTSSKNWSIFFDEEFSKSTLRLTEAMSGDSKEEEETNISQVEEAEKKSPAKKKPASTSRKSSGN